MYLLCNFALSPNKVKCRKDPLTSSSPISTTWLSAAWSRHSRSTRPTTKASKMRATGSSSLLGSSPTSSRSPLNCLLRTKPRMWPARHSSWVASSAWLRPKSLSTSSLICNRRKIDRSFPASAPKFPSSTRKHSKLASKARPSEKTTPILPTSSVLIQSLKWHLLISTSPKNIKMGLARSPCIITGSVNLMRQKLSLIC